MTDTFVAAPRTEPAPVQRKRSTGLLAFLFLPLLLAGAVFGPRLGGDFVADNYHLLAALEVLDQWDRTVPEVFASPAYRVSVLAFYRPMAMLSLAVDYQLFGLSPWAFRLVDLLIHAAAAMVFGLFAARISGSRRIGLVSACLFALSPASAEAVWWESARGTVLAALFGTAALLAAVPRPAADGSPPAPRSLSAHAAAAVLLLLALLSQETAVAFVPVLTLASYFVHAERGGRAVAAAGRRTAWAWVLLVAYLGWRRWVLGRWVGGYGEGRLALLSLDYWRQRGEHLLTALSPVHLDSHPAWLKVAYGALTVAFLALAVIAARRSPRLRAWCWIAAGWIACFVLPGMFLVVDAHDLTNGRLLYVQSAGLLTLVACGATALARAPRTAAAAAAALAVLSAYVLAGNVRPWREAGSLAAELRAQIARVAAAEPDREILLLDLPSVHQGAYLASGAMTMPPFLPARSKPVTGFVEIESDLALHALAERAGQSIAVRRYDSRRGLVPQELFAMPARLADGGTVRAVRSRVPEPGQLAIDALVGPGTPAEIPLRIVDAAGTPLAGGQLRAGPATVVGEVYRATFSRAVLGSAAAFVEVQDGGKWLRVEALDPGTAPR